jgi:putative transposase
MLEYRRRLPHFHPDNAYIFLTWRLWGSLPLQKANPHLKPGHAFVALDRDLHQSVGPTWLSDSRLAACVNEALIFGDKERSLYELYAWVVMPNHVHVLILLRSPMPCITRWLKSWTARRANELLNRTGQPFWQDESYDHWVRNDNEFNRIVHYIEQNPVHAGLVT